MLPKRLLVMLAAVGIVSFGLFSMPARSAPPFQLVITGDTQVIAGTPKIYTGSLTAAGRGVPGQDVEVMVDGVLKASAQTDATGLYSVTLTFPTLGTYTVRAISFKATAFETVSNDLVVETIAHKLMVTRAGTGTGHVVSNPAGIECPSDCEHEYQPETQVTLTAQADAPFTFDGWSGACIGTGACVVTMSAARAVTATFADHVPPPPPAVLGTTPQSPARNLTPSVFGSSEAEATIRVFTDAACTSPVAGTRLASASGSWSVPVSVPANAATTFWARALDAAGNISGCSTTSTTYVHDNSAPAAPILSGTDPPSPSASVTQPLITGTAEAASTVRLYTNAACTIAAGATGQAAHDGTFTVAASVPENSTRTFYATATDAAGNVSNCSGTAVTFRHDSIAPNTSIDSAPPAAASSSTATFAFSATETSTFGCSLDGAPFTPCTSPTSIQGLADGVHTFSVRATDTAGNVDASPAVHTWTVDTTAPETNIDSAPPSATSARSATFTFSSDTVGASFECSLNGSGFAACVSPKMYSGLGDGTHTFAVRARDGAGNVDPTPASRTWTIDSTPPETAIDSGPSGTVASTSAVFTFSSSESGSTFTCALDAGAFAGCSSPITYTDLDEGTHTFRVTATDPLGNADPTPAQRTWTVDTGAPETSIDSGPAGPTSSTSAAFTFSSDEPGSTFQCSLDGSAFALCASPATYAGLAEGMRTFRVRAVSPGGVADPTPASRSWTIDTTPPETTISSGPSSTTGDPTAVFGFTSEQGAAFACSIDGGAFIACSSPATYTGLTSGPHTFSVRAGDVAGNQDPTPATHSWTIDLDPPDTTITSGPSGITASTSATFTFSSTEPAAFACSLDGAAFVACVSGVTYGALGDGNHTFAVRATDGVGNVDPSPATQSWTIDGTPPDTTITSAPQTITGSSGATFEFTADEQATFECAVDGAEFTLC
ncbi:MAG TPA: Ig-like domain-containing protein, partial [Actinomycetota bacterium]|nr:Ig-like domain-containing protein [Actinomycetota bacterium]